MLVFDLQEPEIISLVQRSEVPEDMSEEYINNNDNANVADPEHTADQAGGTDNTANCSPDTGEGTDTISMKADDEETVMIYSIEHVFPEEWNGHFGLPERQRKTMYFERIRYQGNWEILRPSVLFASVGDLGQEILSEIQTEARKMLEEMGCAV